MSVTVVKKAVPFLARQRQRRPLWPVSCLRRCSVLGTHSCWHGPATRQTSRSESSGLSSRHWVCANRGGWSLTSPGLQGGVPKNTVACLKLEYLAPKIFWAGVFLTPTWSSLKNDTAQKTHKKYFFLVCFRFTECNRKKIVPIDAALTTPSKSKKTLKPPSP